MKRLFVTGDRGFVGQALKKLVINGSVQGWQWLEAAEPIDVTQYDELSSVLRRLQPDAVIHLAALTFVPDSFKEPRRTFEVNFLGTLNLLTALHGLNFKGRLLFVGTGDVYGRVPEELFPITENTLLKPRNPYAVSKLAAEALAYQWSQTHGMDIVLVRPFNHIGPGQHDSFVIPALARQVIEIKLKRRAPEIVAGDLEVTRDFTDVRDVARAYCAVLEQGESGEVYNICSGQEYVIHELLKKMLRLADVTVDLRADPAKLRPSEQRRIVASAEKLRGKTGWRPRIAIEESLADVLNYWEEKINYG